MAKKDRLIIIFTFSRRLQKILGPDVKAVFTPAESLKRLVNGNLLDWLRKKNR